MKFHTYNGEIHKGTKDDCPVCKRLKRRKVKLKKGKSLCACGNPISKNNKTGMCWKCYQEYVREHPELLPPPGKGGDQYRYKGVRATNKRKCAGEGCGKNISPKNKSGFCITCFNKSRAVDAKARKAALGRCNVCGKILCKENQTGFCSKHFKNSEKWEQQRQEHTAWVAVNVCGVDAPGHSATDT